MLAEGFNAESTKPIHETHDNGKFCRPICRKAGEEEKVLLCENGKNSGVVEEEPELQKPSSKTTVEVFLCLW